MAGQSVDVDILVPLEVVATVAAAQGSVGTGVPAPDSSGIDSDNDGVVDSRDGFPNISLGGRKDSDGDGYPDECDEACVASGLTKDLETIAETTAPSTTTPITPPTSPPSSGSGTFIWDTHNWDEQTWQ